MAIVKIAATREQLGEPSAIAAFLAQYGIWHECWPGAERLCANATNEEILAAYAPEVERLKQRGGYVTADVINVSPATPNLDSLLDRFNKEHTHSEDEVRFTVAGRGVFWIHGDDGVVFSIEVSAGDLINVPAGVKHWFHLCDERAIRCIRLFQDAGGWTPEYVSTGVHEAHAPLCWGPNYVPPTAPIAPAVIAP
jgi:1,2-dihydroxy-3-keto-5-methylthiopentene dioxygenase